MNNHQYQNKSFRKKLLKFSTYILPVLSAFAIAPSAHAQQPNANQVQAVANLYALSTYALGANESCDIFLLGEYRAMMLIRDKFGPDLKKILNAEQYRSVDSFEKGKKEWVGCAGKSPHTDAVQLIGSADLLADALISAPSAMTSDPKLCSVAGEYKALSKLEWSVIANTRKIKYNQSPKKAEFENLLQSFADMIEAECKSKYSSLMQAGYEQLVLTEDLNQHLQGSIEKKILFTSVGTLVSFDSASDDFGIWRSRMGRFSGTRKTAGLSVYRLLKRDDENTVRFELSRPGMFDPRGRMFITQKGRWVASMRSNIDAIEIRLSDGTKLAMNKESGNGSIAVGSSKFNLLTQSQRIIERKPDQTSVTVAFQKAGVWTEFQDIGKNASVQSQSLGDLRKALQWANAPVLNAKK
ncbi:MAG: hypothetical protein V7676_16560 [Parasphingorhabdus sp.]|uniref:hypothetical protein n=1 Tax=Parasphingorhabdus sp. TaxID=2709688 RepID=UPI0030016D62